jgi:hypothetical protein
MVSPVEVVVIPFSPAGCVMFVFGSQHPRDEVRARGDNPGVKFAICGGLAPTCSICDFASRRVRCLVCGEHVDAWSEHPAFPQWAGVTMPDRHMPVSRRFDLSKGVRRVWPLAWVSHTSSGITAKRTVKVSWGQRVLSVVMVGATLVTGLATLAVTPAAAAASAAPALVTAYVTNSGSGLNNGYAKQGPGTAIPVPRASMRCWPGSPYRCRRR